MKPNVSKEELLEIEIRFHQRKLRPKLSEEDVIKAVKDAKKLIKDVVKKRVFEDDD